MTENNTLPKPNNPNISSPESNDTTHFYVVSKSKFLWLYISTLGAYGIYWHFRNWQAYREATGSQLWPAARGVFNIFFTHRLFAEVAIRLHSTGRQWHWNPSMLATQWVVASIGSRIVEHLGQRGGTAGNTMISLAMFGVLSYVLYSAQCAVNAAEGDPEGISNSHFSRANIAWISFGLVIWSMALLGLYAMTQGGGIDISTTPMSQPL